MSAPRRLLALCLVALLVLLGGCSSDGDDELPPTATASTSASGTTPGSLVDAADGRDGGSGGGEWRAASDDASPWVQLSWDEPQPIASVEVLGPVEAAVDPEQSTSAALHGTLVFSDGSRVLVSGIAAGGGLPTVVAFPVHSTSSVRLELAKQVSTATVGLRELTVHRQGTRARDVAAPSGSPTYSVTPGAATCSSRTPVGDPVSRTALGLVCPAPGSAVTDRVEVRVSAPAGTPLEAQLPPTQADPGSPGERLTAVTDTDGRARFSVDARGLPQGPFAVTVRKAGLDDAADDAPLHVQLFHSGGAAASDSDRTHAPPDMTLQYQDDFSDPLSVSLSGEGARYAALKPEPWGGSQFGDSVFADPAWDADTLATLPGGYLRIRNQPIGEDADRQTWGQEHISGLVSSQRFGGSGFSAQYGYFEARVMGGPGPGAWSAFWMMNSESGTARNPGSGGELDVVELYGHAPRNACSATHAWGEAKGSDGVTKCADLADDGDWAAQWHTYGARIVPGGAELYVDGEQVAVLDQLSHTDEPFFFMLDLATNGGWPVDLSATGGTSDMYVDWVRVYT